MAEFNHQTVLLDKTIEYLNVAPNGTYVDCTLGGGGHSSKILNELKNGHLYAFDQDKVAIDYNQKRLNDDKVTFIHDNFRNLKINLSNHSINQVNGVVYDLGVSSPQFDNAERGFSYNHSARLDMRMDQDNPLDAWEIINKWKYSDLVRIFFKYGGEKFAKSIARRIEHHRSNESIDTTGQLSDIIKEGIPAAARRHGGHPAKKVFQAVRIAVNDEMGSLRDSIQQALDLLEVKGRICVITFQPLEDRLVKDMFKDKTMIKDVPRGLPIIPDSMKPNFRLVSKKPILPSKEEQDSNHRSHSAKLRIIERIK